MTKKVNAVKTPKKIIARVPAETALVYLRHMVNLKKRLAVMDAISNIDIKTLDVWADLAILSTRTVFDGMDALPEGLFETDNNGFRAVATIYVKLNYSRRGNSADGHLNEFPVILQGHFERLDSYAVIDYLSVDTASFLTDT